jgi:RNase adapter protein RapZ
VPIRARAHVLIDSTGITPHDLRAEISDGFGLPSGQKLGITIHSFSFKRGLPRGLDMIHDVRFLRNPHWDPALRGKDGRDPAVGSHIEADPRFVGYFDKLLDMTLFLLPAYRDEGKTHLSIGIGCTGGQHRSVCLAERLSDALAEKGWQVSKRHRELERRATASDGMGEQGAQR